MMKKVAILNGRIEHIYHDEKDKTFIEGATIEEREIEYTEEHGWREIGYIPPQTELELLKQRLIVTENTILDMILGGL